MAIPEIRRPAIVATGGGARGAYEAGALREIVPAMVARGRRPQVVVGTSAGAINAVLLAAQAHRFDTPANAAAAMDDVLAQWQDVATTDVFRPLVATGWRTGVEYVAGVLGFDRPRLTSLVDTAPLRERAQRKVPWDQLHENVRNGLVTVGLVATTSRGSTCIWVELPENVELPAPDASRDWQYRRTTLAAEHVAASSAIPLLFPPVSIDGAWYTDGGLRLNAPLKPALDLGADALVVVANHSAPFAVEDAVPEVDDMGAQVLSAVLADRMIEDLHTLATVNRLVDAGAATDEVLVPWLKVAAPAPGALAGLARQAYGDGRRLRYSDVPVLRHLLATDDSTGSWDLLSYLFFESSFTRRAVDLGRADACGCVPRDDSADLPWCLCDDRKALD